MAGRLTTCPYDIIIVQYLALHYYHANVVSWAFPKRLSCWPLLSNTTTGNRSVFRNRSSLALKMLRGIPEDMHVHTCKVSLDCDIAVHRIHAVEDLIEDVVILWFQNLDGMYFKKVIFSRIFREKKCIDRNDYYIEK